jgi:hypothetical protein
MIKGGNDGREGKGREGRGWDMYITLVYWMDSYEAGRRLELIGRKLGLGWVGSSLGGMVGFGLFGGVGLG